MRNLLGIAFVHLAAVGLDEEFRHGSRTIHRAGESAITSTGGCLRRQCGSDFPSQNRRSEGFFLFACCAALQQGYPFLHRENGVSAQATNLSNTTRARMMQVFHLHVVTQDPPICHPERSRGGSAARSCASAARTTARSTSSNVGSAATNNSLQFSISVRFNSECG